MANAQKPPRLPRGAQSAVREGLLPWFAANRRDLPWRVNRTPYRVWVSELMLQQTRVDAVVPYYQDWMKRFPDVHALASASQEQVLKSWEGLGYYARARNLHKAARFISEEQNGRFPDLAADWQDLPGVGPYTAAAISSLAGNEPVAVLDGNVERVLTRICGWAGDVRKPAVKKQLRTLAGRLLVKESPGDFNEAMMELGATVCTPRSPDCTSCPLQEVCRAFRTGAQERYPVKEKKKPIPTVRVGAAITRRGDGRILIARRLEKGMLGGMWEFPGGKVEEGEEMPACIRRELKEELGIEVKVAELFVNVRHTYSHFHLDMDVHWADWQGDEPRTLDCADFAWVTVSELSEYPFGGADLKVIRNLQ